MAASSYSAKPRRENTFRVDYSQFPKLLSHDDIHKFVGKELGLTRETVLQLQPSRRLGCTFVKVNSLELAQRIVEQHDNKHEFVFDGKAYKLRVTMEDGAVEVNLLELPEGVTNEQASVFLAEYGEVISVRDLLWDDRYSDFGGVKTGVRVARMIVTKNIPSLVTIEGEETAVGYKGQRQTCLHCHEFAHIGIPCVQNKKLLVQKFAADQSYANITKGNSNKPPPTKPQPNTPIPRKLPSSTPARQTKNSNKIEQASTSNPKHTGPIAQQKTTMPPPTETITMPKKSSSVQAAGQLAQTSIPIEGHRRTDDSETDSSQTSHSNRRSRRQPPGKKMRHSGEATEHDHVVSDEDMEQ